MQHELENWKDFEPTNVNDDDTFVSCNFAQTQRNRNIFPGKLNLKFYDCNLVNVNLHPSYEVERCNTADVTYDTDGNVTTNHGKHTSGPLTQNNKDNMMRNIQNKVLRGKHKKAIEDAGPGFAMFTAVAARGKIKKGDL